MKVIDFKLGSPFQTRFLLPLTWRYFLVVYGFVELNEIVQKEKMYAIFYDYKFYFVYDLFINQVRKWPFAWGFLQITGCKILFRTNSTNINLYSPIRIMWSSNQASYPNVSAKAVFITLQLRQTQGLKNMVGNDFVKLLASRRTLADVIVYIFPH